MENLKLRSFKTILFVILLSAPTRSQLCEVEKVEIICKEVKIKNFDIVRNVLTCKGEENLNVSTSDAIVTSVVHSNKTQVTNLADIEGLVIGGGSVEFIPAGIKQMFPNLKCLDIAWAELLSVNKEILKPFGDALVELSLWGNKITAIDADLFEYNPNLKVISLSWTPVRFIAPEFFVNLKKMKNVEVLWLASAGCIDQNFETSKGDQLSTFMWKSEKCTDVTAKTESENLIKEGKSKCLLENVTHLTNEISEDQKKSEEK